MNHSLYLAVGFAIAAFSASPARGEFKIQGFTDEPPKLALAPLPDDPEQFGCAYGEAKQLELLEKLNRCDRDRLPKLDKLVIPLDWDLPEIAYTPLPLELQWARETAKAVVVHKPLQAFAAYENGRIVRWGPVSSGAEKTPTPSGLFFLNWRSTGRHSTVNRSWFLRWYYNFDNRSGRSFHQYELPGAPGSHGCIRLLARDAYWLHEWGEGWRLDDRGWNVVEHGTPVLILGEYDHRSDPPWRDPALVASGFALSRAGHWIASTAETLAAEIPVPPRPAPYNDGED